MPADVLRATDPTGTSTSLGGRPGMRTRGLVGRALREFLAVPGLVTLGFVALAALSIVLDQAHWSWVDPLRHAAGRVVGAGAAQAALSAIATGLVTVTSITFSVLLLAVQQTASSLSPVVFDQFLRRRVNQVYLGYFVGLALYSYLVLAAVQDQTPPVLGAAMAVLLTAFALAFLLLLVYSTIDQMRATNVVATMREHALAAHDRERDIVARTRRTSVLDDAVAATCRAQDAGYVTGVDVHRIAAAITGRERSEVTMHVTIGDFVAHGDAVATVKDGDEAYAQEVADEIRRAVSLSRNPDLDLNATTGVVELANVGWTSMSSAKQNPVVGMQALDALRDLLGVWQSERRESSHRPGEDVLPIVYRDSDEDVVFQSLFSLLVAAAEGRQQQSAAGVLDAYARVLPLLTEDGRRRLVEDLRRAEPLLREHPFAMQLEQALGRLRASLLGVGQDGAARRVDRLCAELAAGAAGSVG